MFNFTRMVSKSQHLSIQRSGYLEEREFNLESGGFVKIGQNSEKLKGAMNKFIPARMYNGRLKDVVAYTAVAPATFVIIIAFALNLDKRPWERERRPPLLRLFFAVIVVSLYEV